jgi:hypothetical protein
MERSSKVTNPPESVHGLHPTHHDHHDEFPLKKSFLLEAGDANAKSTQKLV